MYIIFVHATVVYRYMRLIFGYIYISVHRLHFFTRNTEHKLPFSPYPPSFQQPERERVREKEIGRGEREREREMWSKGVRLVRGRERRMTRHSSKSRNNMRMLRKLQRMITPESQVIDPDFLFEQTAAYISLLQSHVSSLKKIIHHVQQKKLN